MILEKIQSSMQAHVDDQNVEALFSIFIISMEMPNSYLSSPGWYRSEARIIKNSS